MTQIELTYENAFNAIDNVVSQVSLTRQGHLELQQCMLKLKELIEAQNKAK